MSDRCCAHARSAGRPCIAKAMANGRCRNHGGLSTGPTPEGRARIAAYQKKRWEAWRRQKMERLTAPFEPIFAEVRSPARLGVLERHGEVTGRVEPPRTNIALTSPTKVLPRVEDGDITVTLPERTYERPRPSFASVSASAARRMGRR
jgi:hypothetical protein